MKYLMTQRLIKSAVSFFILPFLIYSNSAVAAETVTFTNVVNAIATGNALEKTGGTEDVADAGAISQQQISSGDGYIEFKVPLNKEMVVGLGNDLTSSTSDANIDYSFSFNGTSYWEIRENGNYKSDGNFTANATFKIEIDGGQVKYYVNGGPAVYTSAVSPTYPLVLDVSMLDIGAKITDAQISSLGTPPSGNCTPSVKTDNGVYPEPTLPSLPAVGSTVCDPTFGTEIMRVTGASDGNALGTAYAYTPSFNKDNSQILVFENDTGAGFVLDFDPQTFTLIGNKKPLPSSISAENSIWSNSQANKLYSVAKAGGGPIIYEIDTSVNPMITTVVKNFSNETNFVAGDYLWQPSISEDEDVFGFTHKNGSYNDVGHVAYKLSSDQLLYNSTSPNMGGFPVDEVRIDKSGRYLGIHIRLSQPGQSLIEYYVKDLQTGGLTSVTDGSPGFSPGHGDYGTGLNVAYENWGNKIRKRSLATPLNLTTVLDFQNDWTQDVHLSMLAIDENEAMVSSYSSGGCDSRDGLLRNEIYLVSTDGNQSLKRLAHHRSVPAACVNGQPSGSIYGQTPRANISRDGKYIAFTSTWGNSGSSARTDLFVVQVPDSSSPPASNDVIWQNVQYTSSNGNDVAHDQSGYSAIARSQQEISSGAGYVEFTFDGKKETWVGLGNSTSNVDFEIYFGSSTGFQIDEFGEYQGDGVAAAGDVFRIEITSSGDVVYKKNGNLISILRTTNPILTYQYFLVFKAQNEPAIGQSISDAILSN